MSSPSSAQFRLGGWMCREGVRHRFGFFGLFDGFFGGALSLPHLLLPPLHLALLPLQALGLGLKATLERLELRLERRELAPLDLELRLERRGLRRRGTRRRRNRVARAPKGRLRLLPGRRRHHKKRKRNPARIEWNG